MRGVGLGGQQLGAQLSNENSVVELIHHTAVVDRLRSETLQDRSMYNDILMELSEGKQGKGTELLHDSGADGA